MNPLKRWIKNNHLQKKAVAAILGVTPNTVTAMLEKNSPGGQCEAFLRAVGKLPDVKFVQNGQFVFLGDDPRRYSSDEVVLSDGRRAAEIVCLWACQPGRSKENIDLARSFLSCWQDGPQLP